MPQSTSTTITDGSGLQVLGSVNDRLSALFSNNEGAGQPTNSIPGMLWFDTDEGLTGKLKICYSGTGTSANYATLPFDPTTGSLVGNVEIDNTSSLFGITDRDLSTIANDGTGTVGSIASSAAIKNYVDATNTHGAIANNTSNGHNLAANRHGVGATSSVVGTNTTQTLTAKTLTSPVINTAVSGSAILDEDTLVSNSATQLATQQSIKAYVDTQVGAVDLDFTTDTAADSAVDLDSQKLSILGGTGIGVTHSGQTITAAIDNTVATLTGTQTLSAKTITSPVINTQITGTAILDEDTLVSDSNTQLATQQSIKAYVDGQVGGVDLDFTTDTSGNSAVDLDSQVLTISGGTGIGVTHSGQTITAAIDSTVATLTGTQTLTNKTITNLTIDGGTIGSTTAITSLNVDNIDLDGNTISTTGTNENLVIKPIGTGKVLVGSASGANARDLIVHGDLTVNGTTTTINSTEKTIADKNIILANNESTLSGINGAGITLGTGTADATNEHWQYNNTDGHWETRNKAVSATSFKVGNSTVIDTSGEIAATKISSGTLDSDVKVNNANWSGTDLTVANGGTGASTLADGGILLGNGTTAIEVTARPTNGQVLIGNTAGSPTLKSGDTMRTALGLAIGTNVQAQDGGLADIADLAVTDSNFIVGDGTNWVAETGTVVRTSLGLGTAATPQFSTLDLGGTANTLQRDSDGDLKIEDNIIYRAGGTDVPVTDGGTGTSTLADGGIVLGNGTDAVEVTARPTNGQILMGNTIGSPTLKSGDTMRTALGLAIGTNVQAQDAGLSDVAGLAVTNSNFIVGDGTNWVAETGATARDSLGLGQSNTVAFTGIDFGANTDTTITRTSTGGDIQVESNIVYRAGGTDVPVTDGGTGLSTIVAGNILYAASANTLSELDFGSAFAIDTSGATHVLNVDLSGLSSVTVSDTGATNGQHLVRSGVNAGAWSDLAVDSGDIVEGAVNFSKIQNVTGLGILGRNAAGSGDLSFLTGAQALGVTGIPTLPSGITVDTAKNYVLKLTDSSNNETLTWTEQPTVAAATESAQGLMQVGTGLDVASGTVSVDITELASSFRFHIDTTNKTLELRSGGTGDGGTELASVDIKALISTLDVEDWT